MKNKKSKITDEQQIEDLTEKIEIDDDEENVIDPENAITELPDEKEIESFVKYKEQNQDYLPDEPTEEEIEPSEEELKNLIQHNNLQNALNAEQLVKELEKDRDIREEKEEKKKKKKNLIFSIGIIIEVLIISSLLYTRYFNKKNDDKYSNELTCTNTIESNNQKYSTTTNNVYYFDSNDKVAKTVNSIIYIFNNKKDYEDYKNNFVDNKKEFKGYKEENIFDDFNYAYENRITYVYSVLKDNKKVTFKNNMFTFKLPNETNDTTIYVDTYDNVVEQNKKVGIVCE